MTPFDELSCYTLAHGAPEFIHQHAVDAQAAQTAGDHARPIALAFALMGLFLHFERGLNGREVQLAHMRMGRTKQAWPAFALPRDRGAITAAEVMCAAPGPDRDAMIHAWCRSVWQAHAANHAAVARWLAAEGF